MDARFGTTKKPLRFAFNDREAWLAHRGTIGSSEIATILNLNPYQSPYQLWLLKTKRAEPKPENFYMRAGHYMEDAVAKFWEHKTQRSIIRSSCANVIYAHPEKDFLKVSPDRTYWLSGKHNEANKGVLECKTTQVSIDPQDIPKYWFCQLQYQLGVMQKEHGSLAWLTAGRQFDYLDVEFQPEFYGWMVEMAEQFWVDNILGDREPDLTTVEDVLTKFNVPEPGKIVEVGQPVYSEYLRLKEIREQIAALEEKRDQIEDALKLIFRDAEKMVYDGFTMATWLTSKGVHRFDAKSLEKDHPELFQRYVRLDPGQRRFVLK